MSARHQPYVIGTQWQWQSKENPDYRPTGELALRWELPGDWITDDFLASEIEPEDLWRMWVDGLVGGKVTWLDLGPGWVAINWGVESDNTFEAAPFNPFAPDDDNFLTHFTWPRHTVTDEPVNWNRVPVVDKLWQPGNSDKGGFIQEHTGWRPAALQPLVHVPSIAAAARAYWPE